MGAGGAQGFLTARRLREEDRACQVVLIDDSDRYIMHSYRIHTAGFVVLMGFMAVVTFQDVFKLIR